MEHILEWLRDSDRQKGCYEINFKKECHTMKKTFKLIDLDCANCAAKMEAAIKKLDGVTDATVSFMTQKMKVTFAQGADPAAVMPTVLKACKKVERDCEIEF